MGFKDYKKNRDRAFEESQKKLTEDSAKKTFEKDPLDWYPTTDKAGNGVAIIRFMPSLENEIGGDDGNVPTNYIRYWDHSFQDPSTGKWYIENCLSSLNPNFLPDGPLDPVMIMNKKLYDLAKKDDKHPAHIQASNQKRNIHYRANVYVISDTNKPENKGQLRKYNFGAGVYNEILNAMNPKVIDGVDPVDPVKVFDLFEGAALRITITTHPTKKFKGKPTKDYKYTWEKAGPIFKEEAKIEALYNELNSADNKWSLLAYIAPDKFKTREELEKRLELVLGYDPTQKIRPVGLASSKSDDDDAPFVVKKETAPKVTRTAEASETDESTSFFESLSADDE